MKKCSGEAVLSLLLAVLCFSCQDDSPKSTYLTASQTRNMVLGKWKIEKVDYQLCRSGSCSNTNYTGKAQDYFEFRADSAFLVYNTDGSYRYDTFKAEYTLPGAFTLKHEFWSAKYVVKECRQMQLVLVCSYSGNDPYAMFTDTYYLYR